MLNGLGMHIVIVAAVANEKGGYLTFGVVVVLVVVGSVLAAIPAGIRRVRIKHRRRDGQPHPSDQTRVYREHHGQAGDRSPQSRSDRLAGEAD